MSDSAKDTPGVPLPPPLIYVAGILAGHLLDRLTAARFPSFLPTRALGTVAIAFGIALAVWALVEFRRFKTSPEPWRPASRLLIAGPFRYSRNPIYVAMAALHLGVGFRLDGPFVVATLPVVMFAVWRLVVRKEEAYLERKFGAEYTRYKESVGRWLG